MDRPDPSQAHHTHTHAHRHAKTHISAHTDTHTCLSFLLVQLVGMSWRQHHWREEALSAGSMINVVKLPTTLCILAKVILFQGPQENGLQLTLSPEEVRKVMSLAEAAMGCAS